MTDEAMSEVYAIAREAFAAGQTSFQFQSFPFRMTAENLAKHRADAHASFWKNLKEGSDVFEVTRQEPTWAVSAGRYRFNVDPTVATEVAAKSREDDEAAAALVARGVPAIRLIYQDGGGHPSLKKLALAAASAGAPLLDERTRLSLGDVSRPEALAAEPREEPVSQSTTGSPRSFGPANMSTLNGKRSRSAIEGDSANVAAYPPPAVVQRETTTAKETSFAERFRSWLPN